MKTKSIFVCSECGATSPRWAGRCSDCGAWNSYSEEITSAKKKIKTIPQKSSKPIALKDINTDKDFRIITGISELDRVLGGGIVPGSIILVGGDPGIGKTTLLLQMCGLLEKANPLYVSGEESVTQIRHRSERLRDISPELHLMAETSIEQINSIITTSNYGMVVIDSIQSVFSEKIESTPGSLQQVRECASLMMQTAKTTGKPIFLIGHVTKEGVIAGPKILEHMVDTVLQFEGDRTYSYRLLRAQKNRFGSTNEIGIFDMTDTGLAEVTNPSDIFMSGNIEDSGVAIVAAIEGTRPILIEVQALVTSTNYGMPQRTANGYDMRRLQMILAVLEKRIGLNFSSQDVFVNVAGGINMRDTSADLAIAMALVSSFRESSIPSKTALIGEIGLTGEVRSVQLAEQRLSECEKLGIEQVILPKTNFDKLSRKFKIKLQPVNRISLALSQIF